MTIGTWHDRKECHRDRPLAWRREFYSRSRPQWSSDQAIFCSMVTVPPCNWLRSELRQNVAEVIARGTLRFRSLTYLEAPDSRRIIDAADLNFLAERDQSRDVHDYFSWFVPSRALNGALLARKGATS